MDVVSSEETNPVPSQSDETRSYDVEITIHDRGIVTVEATSATAAMEQIRNGGGWDQFDSDGAPRIGVRRAWRSE